MASNNNGGSGIGCRAIAALLAAMVGGVARNCDDVFRHVARNADDVVPPIGRNADDVIPPIGRNADGVSSSVFINSDDIQRALSENFNIRVSDSTSIIYNVDPQSFSALRDGISLLPDKTLVVRNPSNFTIFSDGNIVLKESNATVVIGKVENHEILASTLAESSPSSHSIVIISEPDFLDIRRASLEKTADKAAQDAVNQALIRDTNQQVIQDLDSLEEIARKAAEEAVLIELAKQGNIVVNSKELDSIIVASVSYALLELESEEEQKN